MKDFIESLEKNPMQGDELSPGIRKIRLAIVSKGKGKSGGARVITYTICASESEGRVYLVDVYDKSDFSTNRNWRVLIKVGVMNVRYFPDRRKTVSCFRR